MPWVLITGAAKGLGKAIALQLAAQNYNVIIHYRTNEHEARKTAHLCEQKGAKAVVFQEDFDKFIENPIRILHDFPDICGLVNNVGYFLAKSLQSTTQEEWLRLFQLNVHLPFFLIQALLPSLKKYEGRVINIGTAGLHSHAVNAYCPVYDMTKAALWDLTRTFAKETASDKMTVNMISPGIMTTSIDASDKGKLIPAQRLCTPEEVAKIIGLLFLQESAYITGQNIEVAGGFRL